MPNKIKLVAPTTAGNTAILLPGSKSESNRMLILQALSKGAIQVGNLSEAKDTVILNRLLRSRDETLDAGHAGTAFRFLTAFLSFRPRDHVLTGSARMKERPIGPLVEALREMGANIHYMEREGYPPLYIFGRSARFGASKITIPGHISSQFISALAMIAPVLPEGLEIQLSTPVGSRPYLEMTLSLMRRFGVESAWEADVIRIPKQFYKKGRYEVEGDWSSASYWYSIVGLGQSGKDQVLLKGMRAESLQGDREIGALMGRFGLQSTFSESGVHLSVKEGGGGAEEVLDLSRTPDLAQTLVPYFAAKGIPMRFKGLESLKIKETDRVEALRIELKKFGLVFWEREGIWGLEGDFVPTEASIRTYDDHRMAMGFAPLAMRCGSLMIEDPDVVVKSYPGFWDDLASFGFTVERI